MSIAAGLARFSAGLRLDEVPPIVVEAACAHLLDGVGCAIAAQRLGTVAPVTTVASSFGTAPEARHLAGAVRLPAPAAALASGALVHGLDYDDTHPDALVHVTAAVLPTVLAVGEEVGASGALALETLIAGFECVIRLGAAVPHGFHARGLHATSVCGVLASALCAARLYGLDERATVDALGIAGSEAGGLLEFLHTGSSTKQLHPGFAAMGGVLAARLAAAGASGPASVIEGEYGLYRALAARGVEDSAVLDGLGTRFETGRIALKPYPACQLLHAPLDAAAALAGAVAKHGGAEAVSEVVVSLPQASVPIVAEPIAAKRSPSSDYEAKFSLPFSVAAMLADGQVGLGTYHGPRREDVLALAARVGYEVEPFDGPPALAGSLVTARIGGETLRSQATARPVELTTQERRSLVLGKFIDNCGGHPEAASAARVLLELAAAPSVSVVLDLAVALAAMPGGAGAQPGAAAGAGTAEAGAGEAEPHRTLEKEGAA